MSDTLTIKTSGVAVLGEEQAKYFALSIFADVKAYVKEHRAEYEQWLIEQEAGEGKIDEVWHTPGQAHKGRSMVRLEVWGQGRKAHKSAV